MSDSGRPRHLLLWQLALTLRWQLLPRLELLRKTTHLLLPQHKRRCRQGQGCGCSRGTCPAADGTAGPGQRHRHTDSKNTFSISGHQISLGWRASLIPAAHGENVACPMSGDHQGEASTATVSLAALRMKWLIHCHKTLWQMLAHPALPQHQIMKETWRLLPWLSGWH